MWRVAIDVTIQSIQKIVSESWRCLFSPTPPSMLGLSSFFRFAGVEFHVWAHFVFCWEVQVNKAALSVATDGADMPHLNPCFIVYWLNHPFPLAVFLGVDIYSTLFIAKSSGLFLPAVLEDSLSQIYESERAWTQSEVRSTRTMSKHSTEMEYQKHTVQTT